MARKVGARIREVLEITEQMGVANSTVIRRQMSGFVEFSNVCKFCSRAVGLQLLTVDRSKRPMEFRVVPGWREKIETAKKHAPKKEVPIRPVPKMINSVFALGMP